MQRSGFLEYLKKFQKEREEENQEFKYSYNDKKRDVKLEGTNSVLNLLEIKLWENYSEEFLNREEEEEEEQCDLCFDDFTKPY